MSLALNNWAQISNNINARTKFPENPLIFTQVRKLKYRWNHEGKDRQMDTDIQHETIIPCHCEWTLKLIILNELLQYTWENRQTSGKCAGYLRVTQFVLFSTQNIPDKAENYLELHNISPHFTSDKKISI